MPCPAQAEVQGHGLPADPGPHTSWQLPDLPGCLPLRPPHFCRPGRLHSAAIPGGDAVQVACHTGRLSLHLTPVARYCKEWGAWGGCECVQGNGASDNIRCAVGEGRWVLSALGGVSLSALRLQGAPHAALHVVHESYRPEGFLRTCL